MSEGSRFEPASRVYTVVKKPNPLEDELPRMKWRERLKTDLVLSKPPYEVKTSGQAFQVALSPFWPVVDLVKPEFLKNSDHLFAKPVENLVLAVRGLSSKTYKAAHQSMRRIPLFNTIIQIIREWDVEGVARELALLQREPRGRTFADFSTLLPPLLRPLFILSPLSVHVHLLPAIAKMYELARGYLNSKDERDLLQRYYSIAREELPLVFNHLRQRLYPVLLKLLSDKYLDLDQFYLDKHADILRFLGLKEEDLVRDLPDAAAEPGKETEAPVRKPAPPPGKLATPKLAEQGFELLDQLFPKAGWKSLAENPDFYAYFQTIFEYPKGSDLIPVDDPIQVIQPFSEILQQLFYGFQNVQWGTAVNQAGEVVRLQEELDKGIARWHFFHEEFFGKNYLPLLQEYCREVERSGPVAPDAKRREHQLLWFKRNYLMPHMILPVMDDIRAKSLGYPNLAIQVRDMLDLLAPIAVEVEQKGAKAGSILNPEMRVRFPVTNMVSVRFQNTLRRTEFGDQGERRILDQGNNRALVFSTLSLLSALDHLLSKPGGPFYLRKPAHLYRTSGLSGDEKPVYNAPKKNSVALLKKLNEQPPPDVKETPWPTRGGDLFGPLVAHEEIKRRIQEHHAEKKPFALISFQVWPDSAGREFLDLLVPLLDQGTMVHPQDDGSWTYVMKDTTEEEAEDFARKVLAAAARATPPLAAGALVIPFYTNWNLERLVGTPPKGWVLAQEIPPQVLGVWVNVAQTFEFRTDVPTVAIATEEPSPDPGDS